MRHFKATYLIALAWLFGSIPALAQNNWVTPGGSTAAGAVEMCLNGSSQAVPCSAGTPLQVTGTFSASIGGFAPNGNFANLTAAGTSGSVALPAGAVVVFSNTGTTTVSCTVGVGSATALVSEIQVPASSSVAVTVGSNTFGACIDQTGSTSNVVVLAGGAGLFTGFGGGGGSGGGGGAVTVADGADVTLGAKADAVCGSATGTCTLEALIKFLNNAVTSAIPTQDPSVPIGGVGIVPTALAAGGLTPVVCGSAVSSCVLKASAGNLYSAYAECTAACWLMVFNSTSAPSNGSTTAGVASGNMVECIDISAGSSKSIAFAGMPPEVYSVGITAAISSTACATLTLSTVAFVKGSVK